MRPFLAGVACTLTAGLGALILGEYALVGLMALVAGGLFGLVVAEVGLAAGGRRGDPATGTVVALAAPLTTALGLVWAAWISSGRDWSYLPTEAWAAVGVGALAARLWLRGPRRRATGSPPSP